VGRWALAVIVLLGAFCLGCTHPTAAQVVEVKSHPCDLDGVPGELSCATLTVWENRQLQSGRRIGLNVAILPSSGLERGGKPASRNALFVLAGGPGQAATSLVRSFARNRELRANRDVVFADQRGTGGSNPLNCALFGDPPDPKRILAGPFPIDAVRACRERLQSIADLAQYTTASAMDDLDEVRRRLGYGKIDLWGGSYGTRAAQVYLRRHPQSVRAIVLDGVLPMDELIPLHQPAAAQRAVNLLFARNREAYPNLEREFLSLFDRSKPYSVGLAEGIRHALYNGDGAFPALVHRAASGDRAPLEQSAIDAEIALAGLAIGLNLSVTCAEDTPFLEDDAIARETAGTFLGDGRIRSQRAACREWPRGSVPTDAHEPVRSDIPALLFSGGRDPVTPPEYGDRVAKGFPNSAHIVFPESAHGSLGGCARQILTRFILTASAQNLPIGCVSAPIK
jgi:pimeloyl-ACP methyl ester carboxylesterase